MYELSNALQRKRSQSEVVAVPRYKVSEPGSEISAGLEAYQRPRRIDISCGSIDIAGLYACQLFVGFYA